MYAWLLGVTVGSIMTRELLDNGAARAERRQRRHEGNSRSDRLVAKQTMQPERPVAAEAHAGAGISDRDGGAPDGTDSGGRAR